MSLRAVAGTVARAARRRLWPSPEEAAWRSIRQRAEREPRRTRGRLRLLDLNLEYVDALSLAPQWHDIFVRRVLEFRAATDRPHILDCGANVGVASLWFKREFPRARLTAFEADPTICGVLRQNLEQNGYGDTEVVAAAVWRDNSRLRFRTEGADSGAIDAVAAVTPGPVVEVPAIRLRDRLAAGPQVDLLKVDIEGAELDVLEDCVGVLDKVNALNVEVHDFESRRRLLPGCLALIERAGFHYALDGLTPATWREEGKAAGPFPHAIPAWVVMVRAWRP